MAPDAEPIDDDDVLCFAKEYFNEKEEALSRIRRRRFGWELDTQPRDYLDTGDLGMMTIGNGPILIDRHTGDYWQLSSSPPEVFGDGAGRLGYRQLTSRARFEQWREGNPITGSIRR